MGVVNDWNDHFVLVIEFVSLLDEFFLASEVSAFEVDLECGAEDPDGVEVGVQSAPNGSDHHSFGIVRLKHPFNHGFAAAWFAQEKTESALLTVNEKDLMDFLLVREQLQGVGLEGRFVEPEIRAKHKL